MSNVKYNKKYGYKLEKIPGISQEQCQSRCQENAECSHFDWYEPNGNCYLRKQKDTQLWKTGMKCTDCVSTSRSLTNLAKDMCNSNVNY